MACSERTLASMSGPLRAALLRMLLFAAAVAAAWIVAALIDSQPAGAAPSAAGAQPAATTHHARPASSQLGHDVLVRVAATARPLTQHLLAATDDLVTSVVRPVATKAQPVLAKLTAAGRSGTVPGALPAATPQPAEVTAPGPRSAPVLRHAAVAAMTTSVPVALDDPPRAAGRAAPAAPRTPQPWPQPPSPDPSAPGGGTPSGPGLNSLDGAPVRAPAPRPSGRRATPPGWNVPVPGSLPQRPGFSPD